MNRTDDALPSDAYFLPVSAAKNLQNALDQHKRVRLQPAGDYRSAPTLTIKSGYELYGLADTRVPKVIIIGGTTKAVLAGVAPEEFIFPPSENITHDNCFERISTAYSQRPLTIDNAKLADNLFLDIAMGKIYIDTRNGGFLQNNRFIRLLVHSAWPSLTILGDVSRKSRNNVLLWTNILVPHGDAITVSDQDGVNFVGIEAESWNWRKKAKQSAMMTILRSGTVRVFMPHGGDFQEGKKGKYFDIGADEFQLFGMFLGPVGAPAITMRPETQRFATFLSENRGISDEAVRSFRLKAFEDSRPGISISGIDAISRPISDIDQAIIRKMFTSVSDSAVPWEKPVLPPIPDPAGPSWNTKLTSRKDSTKYIQDLINNKGIAELSAGIYYIRNPIRLKKGQGIVGAGAARTAIIAIDPSIDIIIGDEHLEDKASTNFVLADITLQGGKNGIHHTAEGSGRGAQYFRIHMSHVTFRDMSESGIYIEGIYGWDNNLLDNVNFYRCRIGIKQRPPATYITPAISGDVAGMTYFDKNVCYRCQFVNGQKGAELLSKRQNNFNAFINSAFLDNSKHALEMSQTDGTVIANSIFINNGGNPAVKSDRAVGFASCLFESTSNDNSMLDNDSICEGCIFERRPPSRATIAKKNIQALLINSRSNAMPLGEVSAGFLMNSELNADPEFNQFTMLVMNGHAKTLVKGVPHPVPQLLSGTALP